MLPTPLSALHSLLEWVLLLLPYPVFMARTVLRLMHVVLLHHLGLHPFERLLVEFLPRVIGVGVVIVSVRQCLRQEWDEVYWRFGEEGRLDLLRDLVEAFGRFWVKAGIGVFYDLPKSVLSRRPR